MRLFILLCAVSTQLALAAAKLSFTISMPQPATHTFHVSFRCEGLKSELQDFKMPNWSPGYYGIGDYARYVSNFRADDGAGHALAWEKVAKNTWRVVSDNAPVIVLQYDVFGSIAFAANNYLGEDRAYISPSGIFVYPAGSLREPVRIAIQLPPFWKQISTGLDPVKGQTNTFEASDYDVLYDCPILIGNQERFQFDVQGIPHYIAVENVAADISRTKMTADLKTIVTAATQLMGAVPYKHYTFLMMGRGGGGIEHSNSSANQFDGTSLSTPQGYLRWLSFIAHEYFHNFNVKRIRPLALGPFDYDQENLTNMLWVSEGLSVYYQDLVLVRAGIMTRDQYLAKMAAAIGTFENLSGRRYQSATESSQNTWNSGSGIGGDRNTMISYYNNGAMLGAMLDLKIRDASRNEKSLDDVMRGLYRTYYLRKKRGFTDAEFRAECENAAGASLAEIFEYASTTKEVNYERYFALAGLKLESTLDPAPDGWIGLNTQNHPLAPNEMPAGRGGRGRTAGPLYILIVTDTVAGSPAERAGLKPGDRILAVNGTPATAGVLNDAINARKPGEKLAIRISRSGMEQDLQVEVAPKFKKTYRLSVNETASPAARQILQTWLRIAL